MKLTLKGNNSLEVLLREYADFFSRGSFVTSSVEIEKYASKSYELGGLFLFLGEARILLDRGDTTLNVSFGDLLSIREGIPFTRFISNKGRMFVLHFFEEKKEDEGSYDDEGRKTGHWIERDYRGYKSEEGDYFEGKKTGHWTSWGDEGYKNTEGDYFEGKRTGSWTTWSVDGTKAEEGDYINGKRTGTWMKWDLSGSKDIESNYIDGRPTGKWTMWWDNGNKRKEENYIEGMKIGQTMEWNEDGTLKV